MLGKVRPLCSGGLEIQCLILVRKCSPMVQGVPADSLTSTPNPPGGTAFGIQFVIGPFPAIPCGDSTSDYPMELWRFARALSVLSVAENDF
jgi:hypothetical protein